MPQLLQDGKVFSLFTKLKENYDLIIIGGGILGAAIAEMAASSSLKVLLLEKEDFASGASSKTSKLAHGGLRYLETGDFKLVRESLRERNRLLKTYPRFVKPLPFFYPIYTSNKWPSLLIRLGFKIYDFFAGSTLPKHRFLSREEALRRFPFLDEKGLKGGCLYYDAQMEDARLVFEILFQAEKCGATLLNYCAVTGFIRKEGFIKGVRFQNSLTGEKGEALGEIILNATGSFANELAHLAKSSLFLVKPSKGSHLVINRKLSNEAILFHSNIDSRVIFLIPWENHTLLGTTDTEASGNTKDFRVNEEEEKYLLESANSLLKQNPIKTSEIVSRFAGLRPLLPTNKDTYRASRDHKIEEIEPAFFSVVGGKYTTHHLIAKDVLKALFPDRRIEEKDFAGVNYETATERETSPLIGDSFYFERELIYSIQKEHAKTLCDWFYRRTPQAYLTPISDKTIEHAAGIFAKNFHWTEERKKNEIALLKNELSHTQTSRL